jgi:hypothetical protein
MIIRGLKRFWTHLLIAFYDNYTIEGFEKTQKKYELPQNFGQLDPAAKRKVTICNLFANKNLSIQEIVRLLDSSLHQVVPALIENHLIKERRRNKQGWGRSSRGPLSLRITPDNDDEVPSQTKADERTIIDGSTSTWKSERIS